MTGMPTQDTARRRARARRKGRPRAGRTPRFQPGSCQRIHWPLPMYSPCTSLPPNITTLASGCARRPGARPASCQSKKSGRARPLLDLPARRTDVVAWSLRGALEEDPEAAGDHAVAEHEDLGVAGRARPGPATARPDRGGEHRPRQASGGATSTGGRILRSGQRWQADRRPGWPRASPARGAVPRRGGGCLTGRHRPTRTRSRAALAQRGSAPRAARPGITMLDEQDPQVHRPPDPEQPRRCCS